MKNAWFLITVTILFSSFNVFAQRDTIYKDGRVVMVINRKMVDEFYRNYDKKEVEPMKDINTVKSFNEIFAHCDSVTEDGRSVLVINRKMVEDFYRNYDNIQVVPWKEILKTKNYSDVRMYYQAYLSLNRDSMAKNNLDIMIALDNKVNQLKKELKIDNSVRISQKQNEKIEGTKNSLTQNNGNGNANRK